MSGIDTLLFSAYLLFTLIIGLYFMHRQKQESDYFIAGRSMSWFPIGLSIMVTAFSAINFTAFSGEVFSQGLYVLLSLPVFALVAIPINRIFIPFYYRLQLTSAYEYLEKRFDQRVKKLAGAMFLLWRIAWAATLLYVPCRVLNQITGFALWQIILIAGMLATIYTILGGMRAVMWTDVLQFFILFGGIVLGVLIVVHQTPGGFRDLIHIPAQGGILKPFYPFDPQIFSLNPSIRISVWSALIGTLVAFLARYGSDQVVVQRYFTARSLKDAQRGFRLNVLSAITSLALLTVLGLSIFVFLKNHQIVMQHGESPVVYFATFVRSMPRGVTGLLVAGLFAATMSSFDSALNSCSAVLMTDFIKSRSDHRVTLSRWITLGLGAMIILLAFNIAKLGSIFEIANKILNALGSPLLAIFLLGMFSKRANRRGVFWGGLIGMILSATISLSVKQLALHYYAVVNLGLTMLLAYLGSLIANYCSHSDTDLNQKWRWSSLMNTKN